MTGDELDAAHPCSDGCAAHQHIAYLKHQLDGMEVCHEQTARALLNMQDERDIALLRVGLLEERLGEERDARFVRDADG